MKLIRWQLLLYGVIQPVNSLLALSMQPARDLVLLIGKPVALYNAIVWQYRRSDEFAKIDGCRQRRYSP
jgi:hypothetical protein